MPPGSVGFIFGSTNQLACTFSGPGRTEHYAGQISKFGVDIGFTQGGVLVWTVFAPTAQIGPGSLAGTYGGATAGATVGVGGAVNALIGGSNNTISLQPVSFQGNTGLNVAAGIAACRLPGSLNGFSIGSPWPPTLGALLRRRRFLAKREPKPPVRRRDRAFSRSRHSASSAFGLPGVCRPERNEAAELLADIAAGDGPSRSRRRLPSRRAQPSAMSDAMPARRPPIFISPANPRAARLSSCPG